MIKWLLIELGRTGQENIWFPVRPFHSVNKDIILHTISPPSQTIQYSILVSSFAYHWFVTCLGSLPDGRSTINEIYDLDAKLTGVEMVITGAVVSDSGTYECKATNTQGTVTKQIAVTVQAGAAPSG